MSEETQEQKPQVGTTGIIEKDDDGVFDFSDLETPIFSYKVKGPEGKQSYEIDMDGAIIALTNRMPTLFNAANYTLPVVEGDGENAKVVRDKDGNIKTESRFADGYTALFLHMHCGMKTPESLPTLQEVAVNVKRVFNLPEAIGLEITMKVFNVFLEEYAIRVVSKKNGVGLPDSCVPTPEPSNTAI